MKLIRDLIDVLAFRRSRLGTNTSGTNTTAVASTTARTIIAAPGTGIALYITKLIAGNETTGAASGVILVKGGSTQILPGFVLDDPVTAKCAAACREFVFDPPLSVGTNVALTAELASGTAGSTKLTAIGFTEVAAVPGA